MRLAGNVIVVTGASRGIGRAVALECAAQGATLALTARDPDALELVDSYSQGKNHRMAGTHQVTWLTVGKMCYTVHYNINNLLIMI